MPAAQAVHELLPLAEENVPPGQGVQLAAARPEYSPGAQVWQELLKAPLHEPAGQAMQGLVGLLLLPFR